MIRLRDALRLAYTKIRTRKIRLFVTVFIASLLFAGLAAGSLIFSGVTKSIDEFSQEGLSKRYIVSGGFTDTSTMSSSNILNSPELVARAESLYIYDQSQRKVVAKRLGIEPINNEADNPIFSDPSGIKSINAQTAIGQRVIQEAIDARPRKPDMAAFQQQAGNGAVGFYEARRIAWTGSLYQQSKLVPLVDGKEPYVSDQMNQSIMPGMTKGLAGMADSWTLMDENLMQPFMLPGQTLERGSDGSIPIVISYSAAQELLKLPAVGKDAPLEVRKDRLIDTRRQVAGKVFTVCYRNAASWQSVQSAISQQTELRENGSKKEYQKPELLYSLPTAACEAPTVERDVRSSATKLLSAKQLQLGQEMGDQQPHSELLVFRVVGMSPDRTMPTGAPTVEDIFAMITMSSLGTSWISPMSLYETSTTMQDIFRISPVAFEPQRVYLAEYPSAQAAKSVLRDHNCMVAFPGMPLEPGQQACSLQARPFTLQPFGSASLALDDIKTGFRKAQLIAAGIIVIVAGMILMGMIGRIIADARRETAVFRAVGASRLAISQIYVVYTFYLSILITIVAFVLGLAVAYYVNHRFSDETSISMVMLFNVADVSKQFYYYALDMYDVGLITGVVVLAALLGAAVPIAHNIQRSPIRDMRDET